MAISTAIDASAVARVVGIRTEFVDLRAGAAILLPQRIALVGQGATAATYATTKRRVTSSTEVGQLYGFGSPLHLAALQLLPVNGDGVGSIPVTVYPFDDAGSSAAATINVTPTGTATASGVVTLMINGQPSGAIGITTGDNAEAVVDAIVAAVNGSVNLPVTATDSTTMVTLTSKWQGASANSLVASVSGSVSGITFATTTATGGATDPDIDDALNQFGQVWETLVLSCFEPVAGVFDKLSNFNEGRWSPMVRRPFVAFHGSNEPVVNTAVAVTDVRGSDRTNCQLVAPGSPNLPFEIAARQLARIAVLANNNPPRDYGSQRANGLTPGTDAQQWTYTQRDLAVKGGSSTIEVRDGVVTLSDTVTFYSPQGDPLPAYRFVVDIIKVMNVIFNIDLIFNTPAWDGAPLLPNDQPTTNRSARKPKDAIAAIGSVLDSLALEAIISDPQTARANTRAGISTNNPKRLDISTTVQISGNDNITSIDLNWGFFFGTPSIV